MSVSYQSIFAEYYDIFYHEKKYAEECDFLIHMIKKYGSKSASRILELACGTGNHALVLGRHGYDITATDLSDDMLNVGRSKGERLKTSVRFLKMDMRYFVDFPGGVDVVLCLFDSIGYVKTNYDILGVMRQVHDVLRPEGVFIFEFWNAGAMLRSFEPVREKIFRLENKEIKRISKTVLDYAKQLAIVNYSIFDEDNKLVFEETHENRYFLIQEMQMFIESSGFEAIGFFPGFTFDGRVDENTWHTVAVCRRK